MFKNTIGDATLVSTLGNNVSTFFQILHHWTVVTFVVLSSVLHCESWLEHKIMDNVTQLVYNWRKFVTMYNLEWALARKKNVRCKTLCYNGNWNPIEKCSLMEKYFMSTHHPSLMVRQFSIYCQRPTVGINSEISIAWKAAFFLAKHHQMVSQKLTL
jgi:hypothetical protein